MFCTNCGKKIEDDARFCNNCGSKVEHATNDADAVDELADTVAIPAVEKPEEEEEENNPADSVNADAETKTEANNSEDIDTPDGIKPINPNVKPVDMSNVPETQNPLKKPNGLVVGVAIAAVAVVAIIIVLVVGLSSGHDNQNSNEGLQQEAVENSESSSGSDDASANSNEHEVVLETGGGTSYKKQNVKTGDIITTPKDPTRKGFKFLGWYRDEACTKPIEFPYVVEEKDPELMIIYARWKRADGTQNYADEAKYHNYSESDIFPGSSSSYLDYSDLRGLSDNQIQRAINEIYARNGYIFHNNMSEKAYFESLGYTGDTTSQSVVQSRFNKYERANVKLLSNYR